MSGSKRPANLIRTISVLTVFFVVIQVLIAGISTYITGLMDIAQYALITKLFFSWAVIPALLQLIFAQILLYVVFAYVIWYVTISIAELFSLRYSQEYILGVLLWLNSAVAVLALNTYFVPHSLFTIAIRGTLFNHALSDKQIYFVLLATVTISAIACLLALINMLLRFVKKQHMLRNSIMLTLMVTVISLMAAPAFLRSYPKETEQNALPNIFIIGFDAVRPDFIHFFNQESKLKTPNFNQFLSSSIVFSDAYTPIARTMPAWMSILTSRYPLHNGVRENNTHLGGFDQKETLAKLLKNAGYETIYATDDRRFNNVDKHAGFNHVIGPPGTVADYLVGNINDLPLSNLITPTPIGKILFPYNYANHGSTHTYHPDNFLAEINETLSQIPHRPVFFAAHFNLSGWPFFWFNNKVAYDADYLTGYNKSIEGDDVLLAKFITLLNQHHLLKRAIVILLSDHGITLALHGDRVIKEDSFQGDKVNMKVRRTRYADAETIKLDNFQSEGSGWKLNLDKNTAVLFGEKNYGIDTSYGYGGDLLSLKQNQVMLAFKGFGIDLGTPHSVTGLSTFFDIAPTILDLLGLPPLAESEGISLKPYLYDANLTIDKNRPLYLETAFSIQEIEQHDIFVSKVLEKSVIYFSINPISGVVALNPSLINVLVENKQRGILLFKDWFLAYYPISERFKLLQNRDKQGLNVESYLLPPYFVLVNLKTGEWTTEADNVLTAHSPFSDLKQKLFQFYGHEMDIYNDGENKKL